MFRANRIKEKHLWIAVTVVYLTILSTLFIGQPLADLLRDQKVQVVFFVLGMFLTTIAVVLHGIINRPGGIEYAVMTGILAIYVMFFFRLGAPERSHLIEYSVLAILLHKAFTRRVSSENKMWKPALLASVLGIGLGAVDEGIQYILPNRIFDLEDILFNTLAITMAIAAKILLSWLRRVKQKIHS